MHSKVVPLGFSHRKTKELSLKFYHHTLLFNCLEMLACNVTQFLQQWSNFSRMQFLKL